MINQGSGTFVFSDDELQELSIGEVVDLLAEETGVSDPARYHIRGIGKSNYTYITLYDTVCHDPYSTLKEWGELDEPFNYDENFDEDDDNEENEDDDEEESNFIISTEFIVTIIAKNRKQALKKFNEEMIKIYKVNCHQMKSFKEKFVIQKNNVDIYGANEQRNLLFAGVNYWPFRNSYFDGKDDEWEEYKEYFRERLNFKIDNIIDGDYYASLEEFKKRKKKQKYGMVEAKCKNCSWMGKNYFKLTNQAMPGDLLIRALCFNLDKKRTNTFAYPYKSHAICQDFSIDEIIRCDEVKVLNLLDRLDQAQRALLQESYVKGELEEEEK